MAMSVTYTTFCGQIVHENRGGVERGYVPDTLGSTIAMVDSSGTVTDTWEYWPYGEVSSHTGSSTTPFTFVGTLGYFRDLVSKLTYIRARFYQALIGQWMTKDSLWPKQPSYIYAQSSPSLFVDPDGKAWQLAGCLYGCAVSLITSYFTGDDLFATVCKAIVSCAVGLLLANLLPASSAIAGCIVGGSASLIASAGKLLCGGSSQGITPTFIACAAIFAVIGFVIGCLAGKSKDIVKQIDDLTITMFNLVTSLSGKLCVPYADLLNPNATVTKLTIK